MHSPKSLLRRALPVFAVALVVTLSACGPQAPAPTPTVDVTAIYTAAFQTITAQEATQAALTPPTPFPSPTLAPTLGIPSTGPTGGVPGTGIGTGTAGAGSTAQGCDNATYASDVTIPDGTVMTPGQTFVKTWALKNTGSCAWTTDYKVVFVSGEAMSGTSTPLANAVQPQAVGNVSENLTAPALPGSYTGMWRLQNATGAYFGDVVTVVITVAGAGGTGSSPSATATP